MRGNITSNARKRDLAGAQRPPSKKGRPTNAERLAREVASSAALRADAATQGRIGVMVSIAADGKKLYRLAIASGTGHAAHGHGQLPVPRAPCSYSCRRVWKARRRRQVSAKELDGFSAGVLSLAARFSAFACWRAEC